MKNIIKNKKAGIAPIAGIVIAAIVIAGLAVVFYGTGDANPYWETKSEFGMWQDELIITFEDGTTQSMKIISEDIGKPFTVFYGTKVITDVRLALSAKATGKGYTGAELEITKFGYDCRIEKGNTVKYSWATTVGFRTHNIPLGTTQALTSSGIDLDKEINQKSDKYPSGGYTIEFYPKGTARYRGYPNPEEDWKSVSLPPSRAIVINVVNKPPGSILVTLSSGVVTS